METGLATLLFLLLVSCSVPNGANSALSGETYKSTISFTGGASGRPHLRSVDHRQQVIRVKKVVADADGVLLLKLSGEAVCYKLIKQ